MLGRGNEKAPAASSLGHNDYVERIMRALFTLTFVIGACALPVHAQSSMCLAPNAITADEVRRIGNWTTATDSIGIKAREAASLPAVARTDIVEITSDSLCALAANRFHQEHTEQLGPNPLPVYVIRVGSTRFVVFRHGVRIGEWRPYSVFDANWQRVGGFLQ
jgi:hypothetical protein